MRLNSLALFVSPSVSAFTGEWVAGRRHGFGEQIFADGSRYEGQWVDGMQEGQGVMSWKQPAVHYAGGGILLFLLCAIWCSHASS